MEFTRKDARAFARLGKGKRAQVCETRRLLEKRSRQLMEQSALLKHDIDAFKNELATTGIQDYLTGVAHVCGCDPWCPAVWSTLPVELLQRIFARLPLPDIMRLRVLSETWDRNGTLGFSKLCAEQNPNIFALVSKGSKFYIGDDDEPQIIEMLVKLYDSKGKRWHYFTHEIGFLDPCKKMVVGNGGLVCALFALCERK